MEARYFDVFTTSDILDLILNISFRRLGCKVPSRKLTSIPDAQRSFVLIQSGWVLTQAEAGNYAILALLLVSFTVFVG